MQAIDRVMAAYTKTRPNLSEAQTEIARRELTKVIEEFRSGRLDGGVKRPLGCR